MITSEKVRKLAELFDENSDLTSASAQTGFGFLMDGEVPKFEKISNGRTSPRIIHPMYLYVTKWGGRGTKLFLSQKLTLLTVDQSEVGQKPNFEYWVQSNGSPIVVKRYLNGNDYQDDAALDAVVQEALKEYARVYLICCKEYGDSGGERKNRNRW